MKKTIIVFIIMILTYLIIGSVVAKTNIIPDDAIRIRIIANSNSEYDQEIKNKVKEQVEYDMYKVLENTEKLEDARQKIADNLSLIEDNIDKTLQKEDYKLPFSINFGLNYFPEKEYKGIKYNEGLYESLLITLGEGKGNNWWCVLFPPICLLEAEETDTNEIEYKSFVKEIVEKYF
jgi:stage II sporulation protein R